MFIKATQPHVNTKVLTHLCLPLLLHLGDDLGWLELKSEISP